MSDSDKVMQLLADETDGESYKAHKYGLDNAERPFIDYGEDNIVWQSSGEYPKRTTYVSLEDKSIEISKSGLQYLTYFLDGSRRVYKVDDHSYRVSGGRSVIYPIIAGQIGVGCCKRVDKKLIPERFKREIVISVPDIANSNRKSGFFEAMTLKLNQLSVLKRMGLKIKAVIPYSTSKNSEKFEDKGTACIQDRMVECEKEMVAELVKANMLDGNNYLIKDGSLEYRPTKEIKKDPKKAMLFKQNYNYVLGISKNFNPEVVMDINGKPNPGFIAKLPLYSRTPVACYTSDMLSDKKFAVWYIRLQDKSRTRTAFDGIVKVEKILVTQEEQDKGIDGELVDMLSAMIINERNPVCYGSDLRWANHIYPMYLTETYVKSKYLSTESFLHIF